MNNVIAGDYLNGVVIDQFDKIVIGTTKEKALVNAKTVKSYELVTEESKKSASSSLVRGLVGGALLGGVGAVAGAVSGKTKGTHEVAIEFVDGRKCLVQLDDKIYKTLTKVCFNCGNSTLEEAQKATEEFLKKDKKKGKGALIFFIIAILFLIGVIMLIKS